MAVGLLSMLYTQQSWNYFECVVRLNNWEKEDTKEISVELGWNRRYQCKRTISKTNSSLSPEMATIDMSPPCPRTPDFQRERRLAGFLYRLQSGHAYACVSRPQEKMQKRTRGQLRALLVRGRAVSASSFHSVKTPRRAQPRCYGRPASCRDPERLSSRHPRWGLRCPPASAARPVREPSWTSSQPDLETTAVPGTV